MENFNHRHHSDEDLLDLGIFATALVAWEAQNTQRKSLMPTYRDMQDLYEAGYGVNPKRWSNNYDGFSRVQHGLGFYPRGFVPGKNELLGRLRWVKGHALADTFDESGCPPNMAAVIKLGADMHLLPSQEISRRVLGYDTSEARKYIGVGKLDTLKQYSKTDVYRFGARVLDDYGRPPSQINLDELYKDEFLGKPYSVIKAHFGSYNKFWLEYGFVAESTGLSKEDILTLGLRWLRGNSLDSLTGVVISGLSAEARFPSLFPIKRHFGGVGGFRDALQQEQLKMDKTLQILSDAGVRDCLVDAVRSRYTCDPLFSEDVLKHLSSFVTLSTKPRLEHVNYISAIIKNGFDLSHTETYDMQLEDYIKSMRVSFINLPSRQRFFLSLIPRLDVDDALRSSASIL